MDYSLAEIGLGITTILTSLAAIAQFFKSTKLIQITTELKRVYDFLDELEDFLMDQRVMALAEEHFPDFPKFLAKLKKFRTILHQLFGHDEPKKPT